MKQLKNWIYYNCKLSMRNVLLLMLLNFSLCFNSLQWNKVLSTQTWSGRKKINPNKPIVNTQNKEIKMCLNIKKRENVRMLENVKSQ